MTVVDSTTQIKSWSQAKESHEHNMRLIKDMRKYDQEAIIPQSLAELSEKPGMLKGPESMMKNDGGPGTKSSHETNPIYKNRANGLVNGGILAAVTNRPITVCDESTLASRVTATLIVSEQDRDNNNIPGSSFDLHLSGFSLQS